MCSVTKIIMKKCYFIKICVKFYVNFMLVTVLYVNVMYGKHIWLTLCPTEETPEAIHLIKAAQECLRSVSHVSFNFSIVFDLF